MGTGAVQNTLHLPVQYLTLNTFRGSGKQTRGLTQHPYYGLISRTTCGHAWYKFMRTLSLKVCEIVTFVQLILAVEWILFWSR